MTAPTAPKKRGRTPAEVRAWLRANGWTLRQFCEHHELNRLTVSDLLRGQRKGYYGEGHRAAVLLGMKAEPTEKLPNRRAA